MKYYQREGLVPEGVRSSANQVDYSDKHVQRVRLIRALIETGGLSISAAGEVIGVLDAPDMPMAETFRVAQHAMSTPRVIESTPTAASRARVVAVAQQQGWCFTEDNPGIDAVARALDGLLAIGFDAPDDYLGAYATAATSAADADVNALTSLSGPDEVAELMVVGTALGDPLFAGLRRLAQQHATSTFFPITDPNGNDS
ncbi:MerR family transcriptional regulator [Rathayibacter sp. VKM Ac-2803]|uniref:MerR family transcriptional regulator n=1 Tax=Rathayibacter sp. VKM Ac-2803 TaxID=2609256 RepID=UPI001F228F7B|nr:MerR family transcriptional regulator [Rathayibacter sp. VKM Ac-2803]